MTTRNSPQNGGGLMDDLADLGTIERKKVIIKRELIRRLKKHNRNSLWVGDANILKISGDWFIQTQGHEPNFASGEWVRVGDILRVLS